MPEGIWVQEDRSLEQIKYQIRKNGYHQSHSPTTVYVWTMKTPRVDMVQLILNFGNVFPLSVLKVPLNAAALLYQTKLTIRYKKIRYKKISIQKISIQKDKNKKTWNKKEKNNSNIFKNQIVLQNFFLSHEFTSLSLNSVKL